MATSAAHPPDPGGALWRRRLAEPSGAVLVFAYVVLGAVFLWPIFVHPTYVGVGDWHLFFFMEEAFLRAARVHGEVALWLPWYCGGSYGLANPQSQVLSPFFWVSLLFGGTIGLKARIVGYFVLGAAGAHRLAADLGVPAGWPRFLSGATFATAGFFGWHVGGGHAAFLPFYLLPWAWLCYRRAVASGGGGGGSTGGSAGAAPGGTTALVRAAAWTCALALVWTAMLFDGGVYPLPMSAVLLGAAAAVDLVRGPGVRARALAVLVPLAAGALFLVLGAPKLWLVLDVLADTPRAVLSKDAVGQRDAVLMFLSHRWERKFPPHVYVWPEYASFVGPVALALALHGALSNPRARAPLLVPLALACALLAGNHGPWSPYELLRRLPLFGSLRVPSRYAVLVSLLVALLAGFGLARLRARAAPPAPAEPGPQPQPSRAARIATGAAWALAFAWVAYGTPWLWARLSLGVAGVAAAALASGVVRWPDAASPGRARAVALAVTALALAGLVEAAAWNGAQFFTSFTMPPKPAWSDGPFVHKKGRVGLMHRYVWKNWGSVTCYDELRVPTGAIRRDGPSEAWLEPTRAPGPRTPGPRAPAPAPAPASAPALPTPTIEAWSPNGATLVVPATPGPARLVWNMNYDRRWTATAAGGAPLAVVSYRGLVAVDLPAGAHRVTLRYAPRLFAPAVLASGASAAALAAFFTGAALLSRRRRPPPRAKPVPPARGP